MPIALRQLALLILWHEPRLTLICNQANLNLRLLWTRIVRDPAAGLQAAWLQYTSDPGLTAIGSMVDDDHQACLDFLRLQHEHAHAILAQAVQLVGRACKVMPASKAVGQSQSGLLCR